jgi:CO dehydrogenase nickel-insertion accessory protein CooC1
MTKIIAFVGDPSVSLPLKLALAFNESWGVELRRHATVADFTNANYTPNVMLITDITSDDGSAILNLIATMTVDRISTAIISYHQATPDLIKNGWGRISEWSGKENSNRIAAMEGRGEPVEAWQRINPADSTDVFIAPRTLGIKGVLAQLATKLGISQTDIDSLPSSTSEPFPEPITTAGSLIGEKRSGGLLYAFTSDKGGCGKTSISVMFAASIAYHSALNGKPKTVVVVDADRQSQMRSFITNSAHGGITKLKTNSTHDDVMKALVPVTDGANNPFPGMFALLGGANESKEHIAFRDPELYSHIIAILRETFDIVVMDLSVGVLTDDFTSWVVKEADMTYYVLDQVRESIDMALAVRDGVVLPENMGGLGVKPENFRLIISKERLTGQHKENWDARISNDFVSKGTAIEGVIPKTDDVDNAKDDCAIVELVQTSEVLKRPLQQLAHNIYPTIIPKSGVASGKKRSIFGR